MENWRKEALHILGADLAPLEIATEDTDDILVIKSNNNSIFVPMNFQ